MQFIGLIVDFTIFKFSLMWFTFNFMQLWHIYEWVAIKVTSKQCHGFDKSIG